MNAVVITVSTVWGTRGHSVMVALVSEPMLWRRESSPCFVDSWLSTNTGPNPPSSIFPSAWPHLCSSPICPLQSMLQPLESVTQPCFPAPNLHRVCRAPTPSYGPGGFRSTMEAPTPSWLTFLWPARTPALRILSFGNLVHPPLDSEIHQVGNLIISASPEPTWHRL